MTVSPTNMNILYVGLDNPISVSVPGVSTRDIQVLYKGTLLAPNDTGTYIIKPQLGEKPELIINAKSSDGNMRLIGTQKFRVKKVPDPVAMIDWKFANGEILGTRLISGQITPVQQDFDWPITYNVNSFVISIYKGAKEYSYNSDKDNPRLNQEQKDIIAKLGPGTRVLIEKIIVTGPDKIARRLNDINFRVN